MLVDNFVNLGGRIVNEPLKDKILEAQPNPLFAKCCVGVKGSAKGKRVILSDFVIKVLGKYNTRLQKIGDCTSMGLAAAVDILKAIRVVNYGEEWIHETATEPSYGFGRVEIARNIFRGSDGCSGSAIAEGARQYGTFCRGKYGKHDFLKYNPELAREFGDYGVPDEIEPTAKEHRVKTISLVTDVYEAMDSIANGYPITIASNAGFDWKRDQYGKIVRDKNGFLYRKGIWNHQMALIAVDYTTSNPKLGVMNSWGIDWITGPSDGLPPGGFWITADDAQFILSQQDSFVLSNFDGYPPQKLNLRLFTE